MMVKEQKWNLNISFFWAVIVSRTGNTESCSISSLSTVPREGKAPVFPKLLLCDCLPGCSTVEQWSFQKWTILAPLCCSATSAVSIDKTNQPNRRHAERKQILRFICFRFFFSSGINILLLDSHLSGQTQKKNLSFAKTYTPLLRVGRMLLHKVKFLCAPQSSLAERLQAEKDTFEEHWGVQFQRIAQIWLYAVQFASPFGFGRPSCCSLASLKNTFHPRFKAVNVKGSWAWKSLPNVCIMKASFMDNS